MEGYCEHEFHPSCHSHTHTQQKHSLLIHHNLPTQCLHPGVVVDLEDDQDSPFHPLENPVTMVTQAECLISGWSVGMLSLTGFQSLTCLPVIVLYVEDGIAVRLSNLALYVNTSLMLGRTM